MLLEPLADQREGVGGRPHGHRDAVQEVRQRADVVFVTVGDHHAEELVDALLEVVEHRVDHVDATLTVGERNAAIDDQDAVGRLEGEAVHADLAESPEGYDTHVTHRGADRIPRSFARSRLRSRPSHGPPRAAGAAR